MTSTEILLWKYLSNRGMIGVKFRRQHPVSGFIIDFYCSSHKLGIEVDGEIHNDRVEYDLDRQKLLESLGIKILRFKNEEVINALDLVLKTIKRHIIPSPRSGEGWSDSQSDRGED